MNLNDKILVTGAHGFLGKYVVKELELRGYKNLYLPKHNYMHDLLDQEYVKDYVTYQRFDCIIHLAAKVGGIGANKSFPGKFIHDNLSMGLNLIESARIAHVKKFVSMGTVCMYPKYTQVPFKESDLWSGYPEETNAPYGLAKKMSMEMIKAYNAQYKFNGITLIPTNLYGPEDNFNETTSHVIPALINKFFYALLHNMKEVVIWGTGEPTREFLYVEDCAKGIVMAMENYDSIEPVNLGTGIEISIKDLVTKIANIMEYKGKIVFDTSKPDGQPRRCLDISRAKQFGFEAQTTLDEGLKKTIEWFLHKDLIGSK